MITADKQITKAISEMLQRAERIRDADQITRTYVEVGIVPQLQNFNNQIIFGRRGTGKTHLFRYLENEITAEKNQVVVYIDCRTLGSASDYSNTGISIERRSRALFKDIVFEVVEKSLSYVAENAPQQSEKALLALYEIEKAVTTKNQSTLAKEITERTLVKTSADSSAEFSIGGKELVALKAGSTSSDGNDTELTVKYTIEGGEKVEFPDLHFWLKELCEAAECQIFILIDEWSSLPLDLQPLFAEFLKRSFLPVGDITTKIAALEYRSQFNIPGAKNIHVGFELGSEISSGLDLDDYFVFDRNPLLITENFAEILFRHVNNSLDPNYLESTYGIRTASDFLKAMLTNSDNFREVVRASEGVIRDMINIFTSAFFESRRLGNPKIDKKTIVESSRQWFERDKAPNLDDNLDRILRRIVDEVIGKRKARSFLIPRELEKHDTIQRLFDARVIHLIRRGYADKDNPGIRYNVFGLDYGTYVDLINTNQQPELNFVELDARDSSEAVIVPFDDKRSIRRIILTESILN